MKYILLLIVSINCSGYERQENEEDKKEILTMFKRLTRRTGHECLIKAEFGFIGCLKEHRAGRRWTKCRDEFGFVIEDLRRYSEKESFECPLNESFFDKYGKQILGAAGLMMTLPG